MSPTRTSDATSKQSFGSEPLRLVSFNVGDEQFAVDILRVQEINRMMELTQVPQSPPGVCGVINLRGRIVPVLDLRSRFGLEPSERNDESRIIVVDVRGSTVGFIVDAVHQVLQIDPKIVEPSPSASSSPDGNYIQGVAKLEGTLLILLDLDLLMSNESLESINAISAKAA